MCVGGHELDAGQPSCDQIGEEHVPRLLRLAGGDLDTEHLAVAIAVDSGRDEHDGADHPALFADLHCQRVGRHERERPGITQGAAAERGHLFVQVRGHPRHLRLRQRRDPQRLGELVHAPGGDPEQVTGRHHADQRRLGPLAALQQPLREVGALPQLGDRHVDRAGPGVQIPVPVAIAGIHPLRRGHAVLGPAHRVSIGRQQRIDHRGQQVTHQIRRRVRKSLAQQLARVDDVWCGHRDGSLSRVLWKVHSKDHAMAASSSGRHAGDDHNDRVTPLSGTQLLDEPR